MPGHESAPLAAPAAAMAVLAACVALTAPPAAQGDGSDEVAASQLLRDGPLSEVAGAVRDLAYTTVEDGYLRIDSRAWVYALEAGGGAVALDDEDDDWAPPGRNRAALPPFVRAAHQLFHKTDPQRGAQWRWHHQRDDRRQWSTNRLNARFTLRSSDMLLMLEELAPGREADGMWAGGRGRPAAAQRSDGPHRRIEVQMHGVPARADAAGGYALAITLSTGIGGELLRLSHEADGSVQWLHLHEDDMALRRADCLLSFLLQHRDAVEADLRPRLEHNGVRLIPDLLSPQVVDAVLKAMREDGDRLAADLRHRLDALMPQDDDTEVAADEASQQQEDEAAIAERRERIRELMQQRDALAVVRGLNLPESRRYLQLLLEHLDDAPRRAAVQARLDALED